MSAAYPSGWNTVVPVETGKVSASLGPPVIGAFRLPTDPLFYANFTLQNVIGGSRFRITRNDNGNELASGLVPGSVATDHTISGIAGFENPMLMRIVIRNASGSTKYRSFETFAFLYKSGGSSYILQQVD